MKKRVTVSLFLITIIVVLLLLYVLGQMEDTINRTKRPDATSTATE